MNNQQNQDDCGDCNCDSWFSCTSCSLPSCSCCNEQPILTPQQLELKKKQMSSNKKKKTIQQNDLKPVGTYATRYKSPSLNQSQASISRTQINSRSQSIQRQTNDTIINEYSNQSSYKGEIKTIFSRTAEKSQPVSQAQTPKKSQQKIDMSDEFEELNLSGRSEKRPTTPKYTATTAKPNQMSPFQQQQQQQQQQSQSSQQKPTNSFSMNQQPQPLQLSQKQQQPQQNQPKQQFQQPQNQSQTSFQQQKQLFEQQYQQQSQFQGPNASTIQKQPQMTFKPQQQIQQYEEYQYQQNKSKPSNQSQFNQNFQFQIQRDNEEFESGHFHNQELQNQMKEIARQQPQPPQPKDTQQTYQFQSGNKMIHYSQIHGQSDLQSQQSISSNISNRPARQISQSLLSATLKATPFPKILKLFSVKAHERRISAIEVCGLCLFSSSYDRTIKAWDKQNGSLIQVLEGHTREVVTIKYNQISGLLASGSADSTVRVWKTSPYWQTVFILEGHKDVVTGLAFMKPNFILSASEDSTVRIWDLGKGKELRCLKFEFKITSMLIQEDKDICYMSGDQYVFIYSVPDMNQIKAVQAHNDIILQVLPIHIKSLSRDYFITIGKDTVNKLWDLERMQEIRDFKDDYEVTGAVYIPHFNYLACGLTGKSGEGKICIWSLDTFRRVKELYDNGSGVGGLVWESNIESSQKPVNPNLKEAESFFGGVLYSGHDNKRVEGIKFG